MKFRADRHIGNMADDMQNLVIPLGLAKEPKGFCNFCTYRQAYKITLFKSLFNHSVPLSVKAST